MSPAAAAFTLALGLGLVACTAAAPAVDTAAGEAVYRDRVEDGNSWTCATCHALEEPADDYRRPAHPLGDAAGRPSYKNGQVLELREAVNSCLVEWMNAEPWAQTDPRWLALETFLDAQAPASAPALSYAIIDPPANLGGGDAAAGRAAFDAACAVCHDEGGVGSDLAPPVVGYGLDPAYVATRVRHSGRADSAVYPGLSGGIMPFWAADRLDDAELRDIVAFLAVSTPGGDDGNAGDTDDGGDADGGADDDGDAGDTDAPDDGGTDDGTDTGDVPGNCPSTHARVGWTAELTAAFHDVGGTAEIVDDCTVVIRDFTYDGAGIDVRLYGGVDGNYDDGYAMTDDLVQPGGYQGDTLEAVLPEGVTLDELDGVSVWCVDVGIDFGSGVFSPP